MKNEYTTDRYDDTYLVAEDVMTTYGGRAITVRLTVEGNGTSIFCYYFAAADDGEEEEIGYEEFVIEDGQLISEIGDGGGYDGLTSADIPGEDEAWDRLAAAAIAKINEK